MQRISLTWPKVKSGNLSKKDTRISKSKYFIAPFVIIAVGKKMKPSGLVYLHLAIKGECPISRFFHTLDSSEIKHCELNTWPVISVIAVC